ncbi:uncharacterized protein [Lolium perenne]|uniref:uncharacterized protein isoform X3 n=1 Tax=Lolium perenne TaxID=4522 RepID=UPI003A99673A
MYAIFSPQVGLNDSGDCKTQQPRILQFRLRVLIAFKGFLRKGYLCRDAYNSPRRQQPNAATQRRYHNICFSNLQPYISDSFILVRK